MTDSEKELKLRGGTRSECGRTPKMRRSNNGTVRSCSEKYLDSLYLLAEATKGSDCSTYAQLKPINRCKVTNFNNFDKQNGDYALLNKINGDYDYVQLKQQTQDTIYQEKLNVTSTKRQILLAITDDYSSDEIKVKKGDVVKMLACKEHEDKIWYFIRNREGSEAYIPSTVGSEFL
jgi:hypothetical protein